MNTCIQLKLGWWAGMFGYCVLKKHQVQPTSPVSCDKNTDVRTDSGSIADSPMALRCQSEYRSMSSTSRKTCSRRPTNLSPSTNKRYIITHTGQPKIRMFFHTVALHKIDHYAIPNYAFCLWYKPWGKGFCHKAQHSDCGCHWVTHYAKGDIAQ